MSNSNSKAGAEAQQNTNADDTTSSQTIAKPNVMRSAFWDPIRLYGGKVKVYHGTTLSNLNSMFKSSNLGLIINGKKKVKVNTFATIYPQQAKQYANERAKLANEKTGIVLCFIVDCDDLAGCDYVTIANQPYKIEDIITEEEGQYLFSQPIALPHIKIHLAFNCY